MAPPLGAKRKGRKHLSKAESTQRAAAAPAQDSDDEAIVENLAMDEDLFDDALKECADDEAPTIDAEICRRQAIAYLFLEIYKCPPEGEWKGVDGVIPSIRKTLNIPASTKLDDILQEIIDCRAQGVAYTGRRRPYSAYKPVVLECDSYEAQLVADSLEEGFSLQQATNLVNKHRMDNDMDLVSNSAVYSLSKRLQPEVSPIKKIKQGSKDVNSDWAVSRHQWIMQLLCRLGRRHELDHHELLLPDGSMPDYFDEEKLAPYMLELQHIAWWDETHRKCTIGSETAQAGRKLQIKFKRNEFGQIDLKEGTYTADDKIEMNVKFPAEVRLCLGVATVWDPSGNEKGVMLKPFDYSGKIILSKKDYDRKVDDEIDRIRKLVGGKQAGWIVSMREEGVLYSNDPLTALSGLGPATFKKLLDFDIVEVEDLAHQTDMDLDKLAYHKVTTRRQLADWRDLCALACEEPPLPPDIDYRKQSNPYLARYGSSWMEKLSKSCTMEKYVLVTDMVQHIHDETAKLFDGITDDWAFYHDALSLMTAKETIKWMKDNDMHRRWILPVLGLNAERKRFADGPPGNSPEVNPLDDNLNQDAHVGVDRHILHTSHLPEEDPRKFSLTTPSRGASAYKRVLLGCPSSKRIVQDCNKVVRNMVVIHKHKGAVVQGLALRNGHRQQSSQAALIASGHKSKRGGARKRDATKQEKYLKGTWWHPDALGEMDVKLEASMLKRNKVSCCCRQCMLCLLLSLC